MITTGAIPTVPKSEMKFFPSGYINIKSMNRFLLDDGTLMKGFFGNIFFYHRAKRGQWIDYRGIRHGQQSIRCFCISDPSQTDRSRNLYPGVLAF